jgi:hypothetical protein
MMGGASTARIDGGGGDDDVGYDLLLPANMVEDIRRGIGAGGHADLAAFEDQGTWDRMVMADDAGAPSRLKFP